MKIEVFDEVIEDVIFEGEADNFLESCNYDIILDNFLNNLVDYPIGTRKSFSNEDWHDLRITPLADDLIWLSEDYDD